VADLVVSRSVRLVVGFDVLFNSVPSLVPHLEFLHGGVRFTVLGGELHELAEVLFESLSTSDGKCKFKWLHK